jgi:hypothetical protein
LPGAAPRRRLARPDPRACDPALVPNIAGAVRRLVMRLLP